MAAKILDLGRARVKDEDIQAEIGTMAQLRHPNVIQLLEVIYDGELVYIIMELAAGGELFAKLSDEGRFGEPTANRYFGQLCSGVAYMHARGVCHRDLKLENLLLDGSGATLKLTDFGFAKNYTDSAPKTCIGTAVYVAPEVLRLEPYDGPKVDAWAAGVILYTMLVGGYPFNFGSTQGVSRKGDTALYKKLMAGWAGTGGIPPTIKASQVVRDLLGKLLEPDPEKRWTVAQALAAHPWLKAWRAENCAVRERRAVLGAPCAVGTNYLRFCSRALTNLGLCLPVHADAQGSAVAAVQGDRARATEPSCGRGGAGAGAAGAGTWRGAGAGARAGAGAGARAGGRRRRSRGRTRRQRAAAQGRDAAEGAGRGGGARRPGLGAGHRRAAVLAFDPADLGGDGQRDEQHGEPRARRGHRALADPVLAAGVQRRKTQAESTCALVALKAFGRLHASVSVW
eukprot:SAG22_NODE_1410_length_4481_cov_10.703788_4_plen_455_part_00